MHNIYTKMWQGILMNPKLQMSGDKPPWPQDHHCRPWEYPRRRRWRGAVWEHVRAGAPGPRPQLLSRRPWGPSSEQQLPSGRVWPSPSPGEQRGRPWRPRAYFPHGAPHRGDTAHPKGTSIQQDETMTGSNQAPTHFSNNKTYKNIIGWN